MTNVRTVFFVIILAVSGVGLWADETSIPTPATAEVLKLAKAGVGSDVILSFVQAEKAPFRLTSDDILALTSAKVGPDVIKAMLNHDAAMNASAPAVAPPPPPTTTAVAPVVIDPDPTPNVIIVHSYPWYPRPWYPHVYYHRHPWW